MLCTEIARGERHCVVQPLSFLILANTLSVTPVKLTIYFAFHNHSSHPLSVSSAVASVQLPYQPISP